MLLTIENNKKMYLVEVTDYTGNNIGLYLVPENVLQTQFEAEIIKYGNQNEFDENNKLGAIRFFAEESLVDVNF
jgi:protein tyrosine/serine phosphatase